MGARHAAGGGITRFDRRVSGSGGGPSIRCAPHSATRCRRRSFGEGRSSSRSTSENRRRATCSAHGTSSRSGASWGWTTRRRPKLRHSRPSYGKPARRASIPGARASCRAGPCGGERAIARTTRGRRARPRHATGPAALRGARGRAAERGPGACRALAGGRRLRATPAALLGSARQLRASPTSRSRMTRSLSIVASRSRPPRPLAHRSRVLVRAGERDPGLHHPHRAEGQPSSARAPRPRRRRSAAGRGRDPRRPADSVIDRRSTRGPARAPA